MFSTLCMFFAVRPPKGRGRRSEGEGQDGRGEVAARAIHFDVGHVPAPGPKTKTGSAPSLNVAYVVSRVATPVVSAYEETDGAAAAALRRFALGGPLAPCICHHGEARTLSSSTARDDLFLVDIFSRSARSPPTCFVSSTAATIYSYYKMIRIVKYSVTP